MTHFAFLANGSSVPIFLEERERNRGSRFVQWSRNSFVYDLKLLKSKEENIEEYRCCE